MTPFVAIAKALGDESRARALMALAGGELCLCQIIELLGLSPSTVSKHMAVLHQAGLVERRKDGRWHYYRLVGKGASPVAREAIRWAQRSLADETVIADDTRALCCVRETDREELAACYTAT
jgi:arsenate reductase/ArsR family transcriptional regulator